MGADIVRENTPAIEIHTPEIILGIDEALVSSKPVPPHRFLVVRENTSAELVHGPKVILGSGDSLVGQIYIALQRIGPNFSKFALIKILSNRNVACETTTTANTTARK
jgi:hypothetical protein